MATSMIESQVRPSGTPVFSYNIYCVAARFTLFNEYAYSNFYSIPIYMTFPFFIEPAV